MPSSLSSSFGNAPWRRNGNEQSNSGTGKLSVEAAEFVPSFNVTAAEFVPGNALASSWNSAAAEFVPSFNSDATEFVPTFMQPAAPAVPQTMSAANCLICFDDYSDYSSDDEPSIQAPKATLEDKHEPPENMDEPVAVRIDSSAEVAGESKVDTIPARPWHTAKAKIDSAIEDEDENHKLQPALSYMTVSTAAESMSSGGISTKSTHSDHELDSDEEKTASAFSDSIVKPSEDNYNFTVQNLIRMRHSVDWQEGIEEGMIAMDVELPPTEGTEEVKKEKPKPRPKKPADKPKRSQAASAAAGEAFAAVRAEANAALSKLKKSDESWGARQEQRRCSKQPCAPEAEMSDEEIVRTMKSILNKLTIEHFPRLSQQMVSCGIRTRNHLEILIHEVFEKATTQHHFINMYADLCVVLHGHFSEAPVSEDPKGSFKKVLLNACQASFERHLAPPEGLDRLDEEERTLAEQRYKMKTLGNIKFVGALLVRKMLASKVMFAIIDELLGEPTPESLESLASLLSVVGPTFDVKEFPLHGLLVSVFGRVLELSKHPTVKARVRCLLKDVLDLRATNWEDRKPKKMEAPSTLEEVAQKAAAEGAAASGWEHDSSSGGESLRRISSKLPSSPKGYGKGKSRTSTIGTPSGVSTGSMNRLASDLFAPPSTKQSPAKNQTQNDQESYDKEAYCKVIASAINELHASDDVKEAASRVVVFAVPLAQQPEALCSMLASIAEQGSTQKRQAGLKLVVELIAQEHWKAKAVGDGLGTFVNEICGDLKYDVPTLPKIVREELYPALSPLAQNGLLQKDHHELLKVEF